jgi:FkbM family methyltransferase
LEGFTNDTRYAALVAEALGGDNFTLIDVGCSGGIDSVWRVFGDKLQAFGFDPNIHECERLQNLETSNRIRYVPSFVGMNADHPFAKQKAGRPHTARNPWSRLSVQRTVDLRQAEIERMSADEKTQMNAWTQVALADPTKPVVLPEFFRTEGVGDIDFIKIDIDGGDFEVLQTLGDALSERSVLGVGLEVNWIGSESETDHTFHNTDRFMRKAGYDLFNVTVRRYSAAALPSRYELTIPAQSTLGRPLQGDALYMRDLCAPEGDEFARGLKPSKILKASALMSLVNLPDHAAEILVKFRDKLAAICNVAGLLDELVLQILPGTEMTYAQYITAFERNNSMFYPTRPE